MPLPFRQWLAKLLQRGTKQRGSGRRRVRPAFETLEDRTLPSLSVLSINLHHAGSGRSPTPPPSPTRSPSTRRRRASIPPIFRWPPPEQWARTLTQVTPVSPAVYTITISGITGSGTLGLNLVNNGSIHDSGGGSLSNSSFTGQVYTINQVWPFVESINRTSPAGPGHHRQHRELTRSPSARRSPASLPPISSWS